MRNSEVHPNFYHAIGTNSSPSPLSDPYTTAQSLSSLDASNSFLPPKADMGAEVKWCPWTSIDPRCTHEVGQSGASQGQGGSESQ